MLPLGGGVARNGANRFLGGAGESLEVTLWLFYIANWKMAHLQMIFPETSIYNGFSIAMLNNQMVSRWVHFCNCSPVYIDCCWDMLKEWIRHFLFSIGFLRI